MPHLQAVLLECLPGSQFHFGTPPPDSEAALDDTSQFLHADSLCSAIIDLCSRIHPSQLEPLISAFENGQVRLSSAFFAVDFSEKKDLTGLVYFLPKPVSLNLVEGDLSKKQRKVQFLSKRIWEDGIPPDRWEPDGHALGKLFMAHRDEIRLRKSDDDEVELNLFRVVELPKVTVHKPSADEWAAMGKKEEQRPTAIFYQTNIQVPKHRDFQTHFYFLMETEDGFLETEQAPCLLNLIRLLGEEGIGGERSVGCGRLKEVWLRPFAWGLESTHSALLSPCSPKDEADLVQFQLYKTLVRGGRQTHRDGDLPRFKMIAEGAVCKPTVSGKMFSFFGEAGHGEYRYRRNGMAFTAPLHPNFSAEKWTQTNH